MNTSIELTPDEHEKLANLDVEEEDQMPLNPEVAFREGWSDIVAGRVYPASSLWDQNA